MIAQPVKLPLEPCRDISCLCSIHPYAYHINLNFNSDEPSRKCSACGKVYTFCKNCKKIQLRRSNLEYCTCCGTELEFLSEYRSIDTDKKEIIITNYDRDEEIAKIKEKIAESQRRADNKNCACGNVFISPQDRFCPRCGSKRLPEGNKQEELNAGSPEEPEGYHGVGALMELGWYHELK